MRLVEQKYFFSLTESEATKRIVTNYDSFKRYTKKYKDTFRNWFMENILDERKQYSEFKSGWINPTAVIKNLVRDDIQLDGSDLKDGIVYLLGVKNFDAVITFDGAAEDGSDVTFSFRDLLIDNDLAGSIMKQLNDKHASWHREVKREVEKFKKVAQKSMEKYFKDDKVKREFFEDKGALDIFKEAVNAGVPNAQNEDDANEQIAEGASPTKVPVVNPTEANDDGESAADADIQQFATEEGAPSTPPKEKGQKSIKAFMTPKE